MNELTNKQVQGITNKSNPLSLSGKLSRRSKVSYQQNENQKRYSWHLDDGDYIGTIIDVSATVDSFGRPGERLAIKVDDKDKVFYVKVIAAYSYAEAIFNWYEENKFMDYSQLTGQKVQFTILNNGNFSNISHIVSL